MIAIPAAYDGIEQLHPLLEFLQADQRARLDAILAERKEEPPAPAATAR